MGLKKFANDARSYRKRMKERTHKSYVCTWSYNKAQHIHKEIRDDRIMREMIGL